MAPGRFLPIESNPSRETSITHFSPSKSSPFSINISSYLSLSLSLSFYLVKGGWKEYHFFYQDEIKNGSENGREEREGGG